MKTTPLQLEIIAHPFFKDMKPDHLKTIADSASEGTFKSGEIIFLEGAPANRFYLLRSGRIAIEAHEPADGTFLVQYLTGGDVLGWSWLFPPFTWHFQARAIEPTSAIILDGAHLLVAAERDPEFGYELMKRVAHVVIRRLQNTRRQLLKDLEPHAMAATNV